MNRLVNTLSKGLRRVLPCAALGLGLVAGLGFVAPAFAQSAWPARQVRIVVPYAAGGPTDILARVLARKMGETLGQPFVVDNRAGANGNVGAASVAAAPPDGYTVMFSTTGPLSLNKLIYKSTSFDPVKDFAPIILFAEVPLLVSAHPSLPMKNIPELIAYLKANPGKVTYSSSGNGSMGHLAAELMQRATGTSMVHVPYKGSAPALNDLIAGAVNLCFDLVPGHISQAQAGRVRPVGVLGAARADALPDVGTFSEAGIPAYAVGWFGMVGPVGMPVDAITKINAVANDYLGSAEGKARLRELSLRARGGKPAELAEFVTSELNKWRPVVEPLKSLIE
jgi:tripartite-type tricarboxylate transporter receptor subunit TctC